MKKLNNLKTNFRACRRKCIYIAYNLIEVQRFIHVKRSAYFFRPREQ